MEPASMNVTSFQDAHQVTKSFAGSERLVSVDFADLAAHAFDSHYYDRAVELFRSSFELATESDADFFQHFGHKVREMARNAAKLNNKYLTQKLMKVGDNHKVLDYVVDEETLRKKKKQPKSIKEKGLGVNSRSDIGTEFIFRKVCRLGYFNYPVMESAPKCGYYHHFNPYLRVKVFSASINNFRDSFIDQSSNHYFPNHQPTD